MRENNPKAVFQNSSLMAWSLLCVSLFVIFPGRADYLHWVGLDTFSKFVYNFLEVPLLQYLLDFILAFLGIAVYSTCCLALGMFITKTSKISTEALYDANPKIAFLATQFLIGQSIFSLFFLTYATLFQMTPMNVVITLVAGFSLGGRQAWDAIGSIKIKVDYPGNVKLILVLASIVVAVTVLQSSSRISYDASAIYFSDAKLTALNQRASFFTNDTFVASVLQSSIQNAAIIQVFGEQSARIFSWVSGLLIVALGLGIGRSVGLSKVGSIMFLVLMASTTSFLDLMGDGKVDLLSCAYALSVIYLIEQKNNRREVIHSHTLFLIGYLAGFACITRPFNAFLVGVIVLVLLLLKYFWGNNINLARVREFAITLLWIVAGVIGPAVFHILFNWIFLGSPVAFISSLSKINPVTGPWDFDPKTIFVSRMLYPLVVTFKNNPQSLGNISPLFLAFLPALTMKRIRIVLNLLRGMKQLALASVVTLSLWVFLFFTILEIRYVLFLWVLLYIPLAEILAILIEDGNKLIKVNVSVLIVMGLSFMLFRSANISFSAYSFVDDDGTPRCHDALYCEYLVAINNQADRGDRVLTLGAYRYYLRPDLFTCSTNNEEYLILQELSHKNMDDFWVEVYRLGFKYFAFEMDYTVRHLQFGMIPGSDNTPDWVKLKPLYEDESGEFMAYEIFYENPPVLPANICWREP